MKLLPKGPELFLDSIGTSARFSFIPQIAESQLSAPTVHINGFVPVYMTRLYASVSDSPACDPLDGRTSRWAIHEAGQLISCATANDNVDKIGGLVLACNMVSNELCDHDLGNPSPAGQQTTPPRLVK